MIQADISNHFIMHVTGFVHVVLCRISKHQGVMINDSTIINKVRNGVHLCMVVDLHPNHNRQCLKKTARNVRQ